MTTAATSTPELHLWTRNGLIPLPWGPYESFDALAFTPAARDHLTKLATGFSESREAYTALQVPWRHGCLFFGPAGSGKNAAAKALSLLLGWRHVVIPNREILDAHLLTRALAECTRQLPAVICIENVDDILRRVDTQDFFEIFDSFSDRCDGVFWTATTRRPEDMPKNLLVRPGRLTESLRLGAPAREVRENYVKNYIAPLAGDGATLATLVEESEGLSFAHLAEMRQLAAAIVAAGDGPLLAERLSQYCKDQTINADRHGGYSIEHEKLEERVKQADPRLLVSALQMTDVFKRVIDTVLSKEEGFYAGEVEQ